LLCLLSVLLAGLLFTFDSGFLETARFEDANTCFMKHEGTVRGNSILDAAQNDDNAAA
jgi:hypothetical protein